MSRIGKMPIPIPEKVSVNVDNNTVFVKGPLGELYKKIPEGIKIDIDRDSKQVKVSSINSDRKGKTLNGLTRTLVNNMIIGASVGFEKELQIVGVGYRVVKKGDGIQIAVGFSHPVVIEPIPGITFEPQGANKLMVKGIDKQLVGQVAADIRKLREPEPYKGKGIKYADEIIHRKMGKAGKTGK